MSTQYVIGIDIGTSGCKTLVIDQHGQIVSKATAEYPLSTPRPGWSEQDPDHWWQAVKTTVGQALQGINPIEAVQGIGLSGQMHGLVALDKDQTALRPAILWNDQRTEKQCREIHDTVGGVEELLKLTNNRMLPGYTGGKILWVRDNEPHLYEQIRAILNPKDYIRYCLTGELATEVSDASGTGLFDVRKRQWCTALLDRLHIPTDWVPRCYESPEISGELTASVAAKLGLPAGLPVAGGGGDSVIQTTGTGLVEPGILGTTIGTAGIVAMALDGCKDNPGGKLQVFCNNLPNKWHTMGVTLAAGGSLRWAKDAFCASESDVAGWTGMDVYELLSREAQQAAPGSEGLFFLPYLIGERCPYADPNARGAFIGLTLRHERRHILRSIFEGVMFSLRDVAELIKEMGHDITQIRTSGGGALSPVWRRIHADVFNSEVITVSGSSEGGAYGAALVAGAGLGLWADVEEAVKVLQADTTDPVNAENAALYDRLFPVYKGFYGALKESFDHISELTT